MKGMADKRRFTVQQDSRTTLFFFAETRSFVETHSRFHDFGARWKPSPTLFADTSSSKTAHYWKRDVDVGRVCITNNAEGMRVAM
jgi:hypothetical protein